MTAVLLMTSLALAYLVNNADAVSCISTPFQLLDVEGECNYETLLEAFTDFFNDPVNVAPGCSNTAAEELNKFLRAEGTVKSICADAYSKLEEFPFDNIAGYGKPFVQQFFNGGTDWNEEYATYFPSHEDGEMTNELREDASRVKLFYDSGEGRYGLTQYPDYLPNFDSCSDTNSVMCCWPQDRYADRNNGNCREPYDVNCIDRDPADNTDLCFLNLADGATSTGFEGDGFMIFPFDDPNSKTERGEGPIHCHGFAWADDKSDLSNIFKGNNLFFVSMYDHLHQRGYVRNIQGAPMCACTTQMPTVSRSDCTQVDIAEMKLNFYYSDGAFSAEITKLEIEFNSCEGYDRYGESDDNDLWSHINRLYRDDKIISDKLLAATQKLVGDDPNMCRMAEKKMQADKGFVRGFRVDPVEWTQLAGRDSLDQDLNFGIRGSSYLIGGGLDVSTERKLVEGTDPDYQIIRRICADCYDDHQDIYYKRIKEIPDGFDLLHHLMYGQTEHPNNIYDVDFQIFSSYEDAVYGKNPWDCPEYDYDVVFPGDCGPYGTVNNQESRFNRFNTRVDVAFYVRTLPGVLLTKLASTNVGQNNLLGSVHSNSNLNGTGEVLYMTATGHDIGWKRDAFNFFHVPRYDQDVTMVVRVDNLHSTNAKTKAGLMIREGVCEDCRYFGVFVTGDYGTVLQYRKVQGEKTTVRGWSSGQPSVPGTWLMLRKRGDSYMGYTSTDGMDWQVIHERVSLSLNDSQLEAGLAFTSRDSNRLGEATFSNYDNSMYTFPSEAPSATPAPSMLSMSSEDIGNVNPNYPGSSYESGNGAVWTIEAAGRRIGDQVDEFHFDHEAASGDFSVQAFLQSLTQTHDWAKAGVMVRDTTAADSSNVAVLFTAANGPQMQVRPTAGNDTESFGRTKHDKSKQGWVRIDRVGNTLTGYKSHDGEIWQELHTAVVEMGDPVRVGMAVSSRRWDQYTQAELHDFEVTPIISGTGSRRVLRGGTD